jgi:hypothetical protein
MCGLSLELAQRLSRHVTSFPRVVRTAIPVMVPSSNHLALLSKTQDLSE